MSSELFQQATTPAQVIVNGVSQEVRGVLGNTGSDALILLDYVNRAQLTILRASRWLFLLSTPKYFITQREQTDYWVGPVGSGPAKAVDTGLNLTNLDFFLRNSVVDVSNQQELNKTDESPIGPTITNEDASYRPGRPAQWREDTDTPGLISIYPAPDNENSYQPIPNTPYMTTTNGGALAQRTYLVTLSFVDSLNGEGSTCLREGVITIPANKLVTIHSPVLDYNVTSFGVTYNQYNVYAVAIPNPNDYPQYGSTETLQTVSPIALGTNWTEPTSGLTTTGRGIISATNVTLTEMDGYIIKFRYFQQRQVISQLTDVLQIPDIYKDIVIAGATYFACKYLRLQQEAGEWFNQFQSGIQQMIRDKNLLPKENDFIYPDNATLGIGQGSPYNDTFPNPR